MHDDFIQVYLNMTEKLENLLVIGKFSALRFSVL